MSQEVNQTGVGKETQQLLNGPLKHVRSAALAAALVPLASLVATPASAQTQFACASAGTVCGFVWNDANKNGVQDGGEVGITGAKVSIFDSTNTLVATIDTGSDGIYSFLVSDGTYRIEVQPPPGMTASPTNAAGNDTIDSNGVPDGSGISKATNVVVNFGTTFVANIDTDFGFFATDAFLNPGTGTPGYWKNHPEAWPDTVVVGGVTYTRDEAISWMKRVGKDKTTTIFASLVSAMLNVGLNNDNTCVQPAIDAANLWMQTYGPVGSNVLAGSAAWRTGEPLHIQMDNYNNGLLCAPHRQ